MTVNYYDVLGVRNSATEEEIRDRFRKLARENHPDRYRGTDKADAERRFQTLTEAVNVLTNPNRRREHDSRMNSGASANVDIAQVGKAYLGKGVKAYKERDWLTACANFDLAAKHNPQDARAAHYLALAASKAAESAMTRRDPAEGRRLIRQAVQAVENAVQLDPMNGTFLKDAGLLCKRAGLTAKAERYLEQSLQWDATNAEVLTALEELRGARSEAGKGFTLFKKG